MVSTDRATVLAGFLTSMAPVGQTERHCPQVVHTELASGLSMKVPMRLPFPAPRKSMAPMNWCPSWHAWTHLPQRMQSLMAMSKTGLLSSTGSRSRLSHLDRGIP